MPSRTPLILLLPLVAATLRQAADLPPPDPTPTLNPHEASFTLTIQLHSPQFGLASVVSNAIKLFIAQHVNVDPLSFHLRDAAVIDVTNALYVVSYIVVVPAPDVTTVENAAVEFVNGGGLADAFAQQGVPDMHFRTMNGATQAPEGSAEPVVTAEPAEVGSDEVDVEGLVDERPVAQGGFEVSRELTMYVQSPSVFFPGELKKALRWFLADATGSRREMETWFMVELDVLNVRYGEYIVSFVHVQKEGDKVVERAEKFVRNEGLTMALLDAGARHVNVSLLPQLPLPEVRPVEAGRGFVVAEVVLRVRAPVSGVAGEVERRLKKGFRGVTEGDEWVLKGFGEDGHNGPFDVDLGVVVEKGRENEVVRNVTRLVRSRVLDYEMWEVGMRDVRVRLRARLTGFDEGGGGGGGAIASTTATVAASVAGMLMVFAVGAGVLCLVPRGGDSSGGEDDNSRPWEGR